MTNTLITVVRTTRVLNSRLMPGGGPSSRAVTRLVAGSANGTASREFDGRAIGTTASTAVGTWLCDEAVGNFKAPRVTCGARAFGCFGRGTAPGTREPGMEPPVPWLDGPFPWLDHPVPNGEPPPGGSG